MPEDTPAAEVAAAYVQAVRDYADWLEANTEYLAEARFDYEEDRATVLIYCSEPAALARAAKALGRAEKGGDDSYFQLRRSFGPITVQAYSKRESVCRKVTVMREVEVTEWECDDAILSHLESEAVA